ncbi:type I polyketide synthase, partial [Plantactinospora endophytica]|uniref:type I polyketide synthase n=1 Tax=Plantactinospora endophytica TaxID=673535 RepID=UPI001EF1E5E5
MQATYGRAHSADNPLLLGSVKSNIGHTQAAAGVAGVIKMVLAMRNGLLPRTLHADVPTPEVDWSAGDVRLLTEARPWQRNGHPRRAGISSFGMSGTNAHAILEEYTEPADTPAIVPPKELLPAVPLVVSASSPDALRQQAARLADLLAREDVVMGDVASSLVRTRGVLSERAVVVATDRAGGVEGLRSFATGTGGPNVAAGRGSGRDERVVFVFPGQGAQWVGMGVELLAVSPVFAERMAECERALAPFVDWSLVEVLGDEEALRRVDVVQPVLWAVMVSLAAVWRSWGVRPAAVVGHSQGEIAAACVAGALSLEDGARVVALRSAAIAGLSGAESGMTSVAMPVAEVRVLLEQVPGVEVAAVNGPAATVVSGEVTGLAQVEAWCEQREVRARRVPVTYASHSAQMEVLREKLADVLAPVRPQTGQVPFHSTLRDEVVDGAELDAGYWFENLRHTVELERVVARLTADGVGAFVEMSPHPVLTGAVAQTVESVGGTAVVAGSLRRDEGGLDRLLLSAAELFVQGLQVDLDEWVPVGNRVDLPSYAFQRRRFWLGSSAGDIRAAGLAAARHPLIAGSVRLADGDGVVLTGRLSLHSHTWLADHTIGGNVLVPGTAFVELAARAGDEAGYDQIDELTLYTPLILPRRGGVHLQMVLRAPDEQGRGSLTIHSRPDDADQDEPYTRHAAAVLTAGVRESDPGRLTQWPPPGAETIQVDGVYERLAEEGYHYGPAFQGLRAAWHLDGSVYAEVALAENIEVDGFALHPALFDAALQAVALEPGGEAGAGPRLPFAFTGVDVHASGATTLRVRLARDDEGSVTLHAFDPAGNPVVTVGKLVTRPLTDTAPAAPDLDDALFRVEWTPLAIEPDPTAAETPWALLASPTPTATWEDGSTETYHSPAEIPDGSTVVVFDAGRGDAGHGEALAGAVRDSTVGLLETVQRWLAEVRLADARLVVLTHGAVTLDGETPDLTRAALVGLLRSAQAEHPGRLVLVDLGTGVHVPNPLLAAALRTDEPEILLRGEMAYAPRLVRTVAPALVPPRGEGSWRVESGADGSLDSLHIVAVPPRVLAAREVRVGVRAAGVNFRDVLLSLGMYPGTGTIGGEAAGVVLEVGAEVTGVRPGDRVMGLFTGAFGPEAVADERMLVGIPRGWPFALAATVPVAFATAWYALRDLGGLRAGQRVLVHAAAGGVGQAAVQLARHWGAEVFGTASAGKWDVLRGLGLTDDHIGSSRDLSFAERFPADMDVVLNSLAGEFVDASLGLLAPDGRFVEMGKIDVRAPDGVDYRAFDLAEAGPDRTQQILSQVAGLMASGDLRPLPSRVFDVRRVPDALRLMSQARHVGKVVLAVPRRELSGTVVVTGATGTLGRLVAEHLAAAGTPHLLLLSRTGEAAPGVDELRERLTGLGAAVTIRACDVVDRRQLAQVLAEIPRQWPLTGVVHAAGVLDDGVLESLTADQVETVLRAKVDAAVNLHELTEDADLSMFVLYSSVAGVLGAAGQANYAAANAFLDALARHRRGLGLAGTSLAWGFWAERSAMTGHLDDADLRRLARGGIMGLSREQGLALFDRAVVHPEPVLAPVRLDLRALGRQDAETPPILRSLLRTPARRRTRATVGAAATGLAAQLAAMPTEERDSFLLTLVRTSAAAVLGHRGADAIDAHRAFKDIGFDSLTAVELRNRLTTATGLRLPATLVFDHPNPTELARRLRTDLVGETEQNPGTPVST